MLTEVAVGASARHARPLFALSSRLRGHATVAKVGATLCWFRSSRASVGLVAGNFVTLSWR